MMKVEPITLVGSFVRLEPLSSDHVDALCDAGLHEPVWRLSPSRIETRADMARYVDAALSEQRRGTAIPFVTVVKDLVKIVGSTRFGNIDAQNRKAEIGWTWIDPAWQRTYVNTEAKLLMLAHAFDVWRCIRVEFKTDALNERSRAAILRLGAKPEGILRNHMITDSGRFRDSVYFSIIDTEWDAVRSALNQKLVREIS